MNAREIVALILAAWWGVTSAQTSSVTVGGSNLSFEKGITSTLFQSVASFDGNQLQLSNNSAVAVEAVVRDRSGNVIATTLIPPAKGGPLSEVLDINVKGTAERFLDSIRTGTEVTASVVMTGLTAEDIKQGVSIEIVAGTKRAQALTVLSLMMDGISAIAKDSGAIKDLDLKKPLSRESVVVLTNLADKLATDDSMQTLMLGQGRIGPVIRDAVLDAFSEIGKDYASKQLGNLLVKLGDRLVVGGGPEVKAALMALDGVKNYEDGIFFGTKLYAMTALSATGPVSTGYLTLKIDGQSPEYFLKGVSDAYKLQVRPGFLGIGGTVEITTVPIGSVPPGQMKGYSLVPSTISNENISQAGTSTALGNPSGIGIGFGGAGAYSTGSTTADYAATRGGYWRFAGGKLVSWDVTPLGSSGKGSVGGASNIIDGSYKLSDGSMAYWGRWLGATQITSNTGANVNGATVFYAYGNAAGALPANSRFTYQPAALGSPFGATGCCGSFQGGTITVDTGTRAVSLNSLKFGYAPSSAFGAATFLMKGTGTYSNTFKLGGHLTGTCTGGLCGGAGVASSGAYAGQFIGTTGTGIALSYGAVATGVSGTVIGGLGATVFKR